MTNVVNVDDLKTLLLKRAPHEIESEHGPALNHEARRYFNDYLAFSNRMEHISEDLEKLQLQENLAALSSSPPHFQEPQTRTKSPGLAFMGYGLPLAAILVLGFLWLTKPGPTQPNQPRTALQGPWAEKARAYDENLFQALKERGIFYMDQNHNDASKLALIDLEQAFSIRSKDEELLAYLVILCENLEMHDKANYYKQRLEGLEAAN